MALEKIEQVKGKAVFVPGNDIDTDRIIPARFMVCVTFEGLGKYAFYDERKNPDGTDKKHPLTDPRRQNAKILLSGENFGCGLLARARSAVALALRVQGDCRPKLRGNIFRQRHDHRNPVRVRVRGRHRKNRGAHRGGSRNTG